MSTEQGPPAPLSTRDLTLATVIALALAVLALAVYILPASYGLDPVGTGQTFGINGQPPAEAEAGTQAPPAPDAALGDVQIHAYDLRWPTSTEPGPKAEGYTAENETTTVELDVAASNITHATVTLAWRDANETAGQQTEPDRLELVLEAPDGTRTDPVRAENGEDGEGTLTTTLSLRQAPDERTVRGFGPDQARTHPAANATANASTGPWRVHVTVLEAGDAQGGDLAPGSPAEDEGTDWQLTSSIDTYALSVEDRGPADLREDEHTFELAPGEGMEHKVTLAADEPLTYAWRATGEVYTDFHGEPADEEGFSSYGTGTFEGVNATFTTPFEGTHGWYWENQGEEPVAITLATRGNYSDGFTT